MITDNQLKNIYNQGWDDCSEGKDSKENDFKVDIERIAYIMGFNDYNFKAPHPNSLITYGWDYKIRLMHKLSDNEGNKD